MRLCEGFGDIHPVLSDIIVEVAIASLEEMVGHPRVYANFLFRSILLAN